MAIKYDESKFEDSQVKFSRASKNLDDHFQKRVVQSSEKMRDYSKGISDILDDKLAPVAKSAKMFAESFDKISKGIGEHIEAKKGL